MQEGFIRTFLLVAYCALVIAPIPWLQKIAKKNSPPKPSPAEASTSSVHFPIRRWQSVELRHLHRELFASRQTYEERMRRKELNYQDYYITHYIHKVEVLDNIGKNLYKIIPFNAPFVSLDELWNSIYQIPFIAQRRSMPIIPKYIHLTIVTPGQPYIKINNETAASPNVNVYVGNSVVLMAFHLPQYNILCVTKNESPSESGKSTSDLKSTVLSKSEKLGKTLVTKSIVLDFVGAPRTTITPNYIWREANRLIEDFSVWYNVNKIRVQAYDHNGQVTTDAELLKANMEADEQQLNTENGIIYVDLEYGLRPGSASGVQHIVRLWIRLRDNNNRMNYLGVFRFTENTTTHSIWQKSKHCLSHSSQYRESRLVEVHIEIIGIENLVITDNNENDNSNSVNFENAIAVVLTIRLIPPVRHPESMRVLMNNAILESFNNTEQHKRGFPEDKLEKNLPQVEVAQEIANEKFTVCLEELKGKKDEVTQLEKEKEQVTQLLCGHFFHRDCAKHWLVQKKECPNCRKDLADWDFKAPTKKGKGKA